MSDGDLSKELDDRFGSQCGDILVFFDALDNCNSKSVNVKVTVSNSNPNIVMVGFRVHVGNTLANNIPSEITIFQRVIKLDEGMRSWYDIPFIVAKSLLADEEITISIGTTFNGSTLPRIDTLEIYGRVKDEFGWKEKMDALLDMEARVLGSSSWVSGSWKKRCIGQVTPIEEQVVADGLNLSSRLYALYMIKGMFLAVVIGPPVVVAIILIVQGKESILNILETLKEEGNRVLFNALAVFALREINLSKVTFSTTTFYLSRMPSSLCFGASSSSMLMLTGMLEALVSSEMDSTIETSYRVETDDVVGVVELVKISQDRGIEI
ncbi:unnamed protein product [Lactuca saligna]|uniref:Uncharacterized protein n=1 Tax=Lactuca saligna TaxID=75948 RepID=A0AA35YL13_LACSI|nr:unnamed protein product [Lactuca saligna]